jgi:hypothetical protein
MRYIHKWHTPIVIRVLPSSEPEYFYYSPIYDPTKLPVLWRDADVATWYRNDDGWWNS